MIGTSVGADGVAECVLDHPPVNALPVAGWFQLASALRALGCRRAGAGSDTAGRGSRVLRGRRYQGTAGGRGLQPRWSRVNRGCAAAFAAVYECQVPVIAAVQGFCLGGGVGLAGCADIIVASEDATFGLPEVDRGALGAATHLARLVPQHRMRALMYTAATATAAELHGYGSVLQVVPRDDLRDGRAGRGQAGGREGPGGDQGGEGVAERHRPCRRAPQLPLRAGLHVRAEPAGVADRVRDGFGEPEVN